MGDAATAEDADLLFVAGLARGQHDPGAELLPHQRVGDAHHLHVGDLGMAVEEFLDLARIDVLAAADDHVLDPPDDVAVALLVDGADVAGVHPAVGVDRLGRPLRIVPVAEHHRIAAGAELARLPARDGAALRVDHLDLQVRLHAADGGHPPLERIVQGALEADRAGLGHAVGDGHAGHVHPVHHMLHHLDRAR